MTDVSPYGEQVVMRQMAVTGRQCGDCAMCCYVPGIPELDKPGDVWCRHCVGQRSCGVYPNRPRSCRDFACLWLVHPNIDDVWYPPIAHMMLDMVDETIRVTVDPDHPERWREEPYFSKLTRWAHDRKVVVSLNGTWRGL